ncbi:hypothetical protein GCM10011607_28400 [Shewanella inventionis]|uniref:Uncharacterized protein n=1 Tax=Shewanella inventionis TaxID=1738770 RepID=A0ABQ1JE21_9GAMM|nr:hypothetical protein [Shewanella inventionis]GGB66018.1 hypothetical protein GCM10011607_28400 [Shewanella inventionis]
MYQFYRGYGQLIATQSAKKNLSEIHNASYEVANEISNVKHAIGLIYNRKIQMNDIINHVMNATADDNIQKLSDDVFRRYVFDHQANSTRLSHAEFLNKYCYDYAFTLELAGRYMSNIAAFSDVPVIGPNYLKLHNMQLYAEVQTHIKAIKDRRDFAILNANLLKLKPKLPDEEFFKYKAALEQIKVLITDYNYLVLARDRAKQINREEYNVVTFADIPDDYYLSQVFAIKYGLGMDFSPIDDIPSYCKALDPMKGLADKVSLPFDFMEFPPRILAMAANQTLTGLDVLDVITGPIGDNPAVVDCLPEILKGEGKTISQHYLDLTVRI